MDAATKTCKNCPTYCPECLSATLCYVCTNPSSYNRVNNTSLMCPCIAGYYEGGGVVCLRKIKSNLK